MIYFFQKFVNIFLYFCIKFCTLKNKKTLKIGTVLSHSFIFQ